MVCFSPVQLGSLVMKGVLGESHADGCRSFYLVPPFWRRGSYQKETRSMAGAKIRSPPGCAVR